MAEQQENPAEPPMAPPAFKRKAFVPPSFLSKKHALEPTSSNVAGRPPMAGRPALGIAAAAGALSAAAKPEANPEARFWTVLYCKRSNKIRKNRTFADGVLEVRGTTAVLRCDEGKTVSQTVLRGYDPSTFGEGSEILMGNWEVEIDAPMEADKFRSGEAFLKPTATTVVLGASTGTLCGSAPFKKLAGGLGGGFKPVARCSGGLLGKPAGGREAPKAAPALHDPHAPGAIVLNRDEWGGKGEDEQGRPVTAVVVDPYIARHLRPHQVEGVRFMYECVMGLRDPGARGAILADEMGLGKTLQVLALVWTLLRQGPRGRPAIRRAIVATPSSLTANWAQEIRKWLGDERMRCTVLAPGAEAAQQALDFRVGSVTPVLISSYETLRKHAAGLAGVADLLVCDEGHRLKSAAGNKTIGALASLGCARTVLLTGTPLQNNLSEFFAMASFVNPGSLGTLAVFERVFGHPITRSRDRGATEEERRLGEERSKELARRVAQFVLRRTSEVNARYLPPLSLYVVFCKPTQAQLAAYSRALGSSGVRSVLSAAGSDYGDQVLSVITQLKKICNHPALLGAPADGQAAADAAEGEPASSGADARGPALSGKLSVLAALLRATLDAAGERAVVVSQSTAALDLVAALCEASGWATVRIDGATDVGRRQDVVNAFNRHNVGQVFLLSTTAGGAGLNLTGASRLILYDSHWNPAMDEQAMARIWRDGQARPCVVYRLLCTGTIDEKMWQRQLSKGDVAATMMTAGCGGGAAAALPAGHRGGGGGRGGGQFSREELRQLFSLRADTACDTFDVLQATGGEAAAAFRDVSATCGDAPLRAALAEGHVTFVHLERQQLGGAALAASAAAPPGAGGSGAPSSLEPSEEAGASGPAGSGSGAEELEVDDD